MKTTAAVKKMSDMVLQCEHRAAWTDLFAQTRGGTMPRTLSNRCAMLEGELRSRGLVSLFDSNKLNAR